MKIEINKNLDKEVYLSFYNAVVEGADFGNKIKKDHPDISLDNYIGYIDEFYDLHKEELLATVEDMKSCFNEIKEALILEFKKYFGIEFNDEDYTCCVSIFDCNPRYLETKSFQVYFRRLHDMRKEVIAHELTHFAFFDFCAKNNISSGDYLWELSEIFNVLFLNTPPVREAISSEELLFYPNLKDKFESIKLFWNKNLNAIDFIKQSLEHLKSFQSSH
jgi:hypothetical protein